MEEKRKNAFILLKKIQNEKTTTYITLDLALSISILDNRNPAF